MPLMDTSGGNGLVLASVAGLLVLTTIVYEYLFSSLKAFPGPAISKFTDTWRAAWTAKGDIDTTHLRWHRKYGSAVRIGPNTISISDPNLIKTIYATKDAWIKTDMYRPNDALINGQRLSNVFNTSDNAWHAQQMRPIRGLWTMTKVLELEELIDETISKLTNKLDVGFVDGASAGKTAKMDDWLTWFAWDVAANISFGRHYGFLDQEKDVDSLITDSTKGLRYFAPVSQIPWIDKLLDKNPVMRIGPKPTLTAIFYTFRVVGEYQAELAAKGQKTSDNNAEHYLDKYLKLKDSHPETVKSDNEVVTYLALNVLAGGDTTAATVRAAAYYLAKNPDAQNKLSKELTAARLSLPAQWKDIKDLPYLDACMREVMRINPGIAMIFERLVPAQGLALPDGRFIPGGTKVGINPAVTNHDAGVFGDRPDEFNPDRWLRKSGESEADHDTRTKKMRETLDFTFGGGSRVCLGKNFALLELWKLCATLYSLYDIKLVDPKHKWDYHAAWFVYQYDMPMKITRKAQ